MPKVPLAATMPPMRVKRVLMANELASYRQTIAVVLRELRPDVEVIETDSGALNQQVLRLTPDLVICSRATSVVRDRVPNWIELYPNCESLSTIFIGGERSTVDDVQLSDLISLVDRVEPSPVQPRSSPGLFPA